MKETNELIKDNYNINMDFVEIYFLALQYHSIRVKLIKKRKKIVIIIF